MSASARDHGSQTLSIGEVLSLLKKEFPDVTISKIRFLETEGLVTPARTASGYRRFSHTDVAQLQAVLRMQRDQYLPLKVIREQLEDGPPDAASRPAAGLGLRADDFRPGAGRVRITRGELAEAVSMNEGTIADLEKLGLVWATPAGHYDEDALAICQVVSRLMQFNVEPRHLRPFRVVADRESGLVEQIAIPFSDPRGQDGRARHQEVIRDLAALFVQLHAALLRAELIRGGKA